MNIKSKTDLFLDKIRPHILEYLQSKGYNTTGPISCLNPEHKDSAPSMLVSRAEQNSWRVWCSSCGTRYDIFDAYAVLEDTPRRGPGWFTNTVIPLATKFKIPIPNIELSAEEQFANDLYRTFEDVASLLNHNVEKMTGFAREYILDRQWTKETLENLDIGTITYESICRGVEETDRRRFGLNRPELFNKENIIFTVRDQYGRPLRFFARGENQKNKYDSTAHSTLAYNIWTGKGHLYLSHLIDRKNSSGILVEGHSSAVTAYQAGYRNVVAPCGCLAFGEAHTDSLALNGILKCTIAFDGDSSGQEATESLLRKDFAKTGGINFDVMLLPAEHDPDSYIRLEGKDKFEYLFQNKLTAFEYLLSKEQTNQSPEELCERLVPYIASSKSEVRRELMARDLAAFLDNKISVSSIMSDVNRADQAFISAIVERQKAVVTAGTRQANQSPIQAKEILRETLDKLEDIEKESSSLNGRSAGLAKLQGCKTFEENSNSGSYILHPAGLGNLSDILDGGDWIGNKVIIVAGVRNAGKSTFIDNFTWQILDNEDNNAIVYLLTIDDPASSRYHRIGCSIVNELDFTQNMMANPRYYAEEHGLHDVYEKRDYAYSRLTELVGSGRLIIEDSNEGTTLAYAERRISQIRREFPDKNLIFALDNFHDCTDYVPDVKDQIGRQIKYARRLCVKYRALGLFSAEYKKLNDPTKPGTDNDLADSRALQYVPALTMHLYSDLEHKGDDKAILIHNYHGRVMPRVVIDIGKNKITEAKGKGKLVYNLYPGAALFKGVPLEQAKREERERRESLKQTQSDDDDE